MAAAEAGGLQAFYRKWGWRMVARKRNLLIPGNLRPAPLVLGG
jgi:hypothetical protein